MLTNSRDINAALSVKVGRSNGSEVLKHPTLKETVVLPHPKKDLGPGLVRAIYKAAQWPAD
jgi:predicted RNA binding protein YcfA (HicA-like mRNA interferase family)